MTATIISGDCRTELATMWPGSAQAVICSPPYPGQRIYGTDGREIGRGTLTDWLDEMGVVLDGCANALDTLGTAWFVLGDKAIGSGGRGGDFAAGNAKEWNSMPASKFRPGDIHLRDGQWALAPERFAMLAQARGWLVRSIITWDQMSNEVAAPAHVRRPLTCAERIVVLARSPKYRWNVAAQLELPYEERGDVWHLRAQRPPKSVRHFAPYPSQLAARMISLATEPGDTVLDPFSGSHTTITQADAMDRHGIGIELYHTTEIEAAR